MFKGVLFPLLLVSCITMGMLMTHTASGQVSDSLTLASKKRANRSAIYSAILPGLGQFKNKKYWKIPVLYAGFGTLYYFIHSNNNYYKEFKTAYQYRTDENATTLDGYPRLSNDDIKIRKDYYRRNRDLSIILTGVLYTMNIIDAYVDAQLMDFDVSDQLSLRMGPGLIQDNGKSVTPALCLTFSIR